MNKTMCTLLVDDDQTTNFVNRRLLEGMAVSEKVLVAHNGQEALQLIRKQCESGCCPQLILLDINMPVMNGFEFLDAYAQLELSQKQSVVIIMLTTSLHPRDVERIREAPIQGFLSKPLTKEKVHKLLRQHFNQEPPA